MVQAFSFSLQGEKRLLDKFKKLPFLIQREAGLKTVTEGILALERAIKVNVSGKILRVRSGRLRASITHRISQTSDGIEGKVGPNVPYARIHEFGGVIRPKRSKHLTIPINEALTPAGVPRYTARRLISSPGIGGFERTFSAKKVIFGVRRGRAIPVFALVDMVRIKEKRYMRISLAETQTTIIESFRRNVQAAINRA